MRFVVAVVLAFFASPVIAAEKATIISTELGQFPALVGKNLPEFVKQAARLVPSSALPADFGPLLDKIVVVTDAKAFAVAMGLPQVSVMSVELTSKTVYIVMDKKLQPSSVEDPLTWVLRAEEEWQAARLRRVPNRGMAPLLAAKLIHELKHVGLQTTDEGHSNAEVLNFLDIFVRRGEVDPELVRGYRAVLGQQQ